MPLNLAAVEARLEEGTREGLSDAGDHVQGVAVDRCPIEYGALRRSAKTTITGKARVSVSFGSPSDETGDYAVVQHEALEFHHDDGEAKYLESAITSEAQQCKALIAAALRRALA